MQVSTTKHSSMTSVEPTAGMASSGSRVAMFVLATWSGGVSGSSISDESVNAAVTTGSGSRATGLGSVAGASVIDWLAATTSAATTSAAALDAVGGGLSANVASAVSNGARRSTIGAAPILSIPAELNAANASTEAGKATSLHNAAIAANRGFMITVST